MLECDRRGARIGIEAPAETNIQREELLLRVTSENQRARATGEHKWLQVLPLRKPEEQPVGPTSVRVPPAAKAFGGAKPDD